MKDVIETILKANKIALFTHKNADPDALGSVGAFLHAMKILNKTCHIFLNEKPQENFDFLRLENVVLSEQNFIDDFDLFVSLDASTCERLGIYSQIFKAKENTIEIDHHRNRETFAKQALIKFYSSNSEILLELFEEMGMEVEPIVATCLYTGLVGDTDGFKNGSTTQHSLKNGARMLESGADINLVNNALYNSKTEADFAIMKRVLERVEFFNHIAISFVTEKDSKELGKEKFLTSDLVNLIGTIKGIEISALIKQDKGKNFRISLRSSKNYNVGSFCANFGGGGHNQAAGMALVGSLKQVKHILLKELKKLEKSN